MPYTLFTILLIVQYTFTLILTCTRVYKANYLPLPRGHVHVCKHYFYAPAIRIMRKGIKRCPCPCMRACVCASVRPSFKWVLCERNSSYNFIPIILKHYRCFCQGLKMCMTFEYNPQINFCHFFHSLNLVIFGLNYN